MDDQKSAEAIVGRLPAIEGLRAPDCAPRTARPSGVCEGGLVTASKEGTPQGGPLSPLLSNILLTDLDLELEKREHKFCRYADDVNIYVKSEKSG